MQGGLVRPQLEALGSDHVGYATRPLGKGFTLMGVRPFSEVGLAVVTSRGARVGGGTLGHPETKAVAASAPSVAQRPGRCIIAWGLLHLQSG